MQVGETATLPWCVRMNSNGDAIVNSVCETRCDLASIRNQMQDKQTSKASSSVEGTSFPRSCSSSQQLKEREEGLKLFYRGCKAIYSDEKMITFASSTKVSIIVKSAPMGVNPILIVLIPHVLEKYTPS